MRKKLLMSLSTIVCSIVFSVSATAQEKLDSALIDSLLIKRTGGLDNYVRKQLGLPPVVGHASQRDNTEDSVVVNASQRDNTEDSVAWRAGTGPAPTLNDSLPIDTMALMRPQRLLTSQIRLLARTYGDRVYLRWVPEDYVSWLFLCEGGVNVLRTHRPAAVPGASSTGMIVDTLAYALKPLTQKQFEQHFKTDDDDAMVAMGVLYGEGRTGYGQTRQKPGSMGANTELNNEQDISFAFAMLVAEWRPDVAKALAVGLVDSTAVEGEVYDYYVQPTVWDTNGKIIFEPGVQTALKNLPFVPRQYDPQLSDTLLSPRRFTLRWHDGYHSSYEIDRREVTDPKANTVTEWRRVNPKPYVSMLGTSPDNDLVLLSDSVPHNGTYEYRIYAHDAFGTLTTASPVLRAYARDIEPPLTPEIKNVILERPEKDPMARVIAHVIWENPGEQYPDIKGYIVSYQNSELTQGQWEPLAPLSHPEGGTVAPSASKTNEAPSGAVGGALISPTDTIAAFDVTDKATGMLSIAAYDETGNMAMSVPQLIRLTDYRAPAPPDSLQCMVLKTGFALLRWVPKPEDTDIMYYDIGFANDSTHTFLRLNEKGIKEPMYVDTLALDANQKYIYYKVRACDYSGNIGEWSPFIQVKRPHNSAPTIPHLQNSCYDETKGMHMEWVVGKDADMEYHLLQRRLAPSSVGAAASKRRNAQETDWQTLARWDADSLARLDNYIVTVDDNPAYNQEMRYYYRVVSYNSTGLNSSSLAVSWLHRGPRYYDIKISLAGDYFEKEEQVRLVWERGELPLEVRDADYYYCIFRKGQDDKSFRYMINVPSDKTEYTDRTLRKGEQADYYVTIRFRDGRESTVSNTVTVKR